MNTPLNSINFDVDSWKIKVTERKRGRMKFQIKLDKQETEGFMEFSNSLKPEQMPDDEWIRSIFYKGLEKIQEDIMESMRKYMEEHQDDIDTSAMELMQDASGAIEIVEDTSETE
jgi:hypothetical protein